MLWAEKFGVDEGRMPSLDELREAFPKMSNDEWKGFYTARHFQDTLYGIQNARLYNNWNARGFVSVSKPGLNQAYHGKPVARGEVKVESFLDPETGKSVKLSSQELDDFYTNGGSVIKMDMSMQGSKGQAHYYVLVDSRQGWRSGALRKHVLEYIPGYNTRIYEDAHFIQRVKKNAIIDGKPQEHISTMRVASTQIEAEAFQKRVIDALGRKLYKDQWNKNWSIGRKHKALEEKGYDIVVSRDARLSDADRIQVDLSKLQTEGRLFFDNRQKKAIRNTDNQPADIVDPVNAVQRTARMVARQVSTEQLVSTQKQQFFSKYKDLKIREGDTSSEIDGFLTSLIKTGSKEESLRATKARAWWRYIRFMEGSMNAQPSMFRRAAIKVSEWVDFNIGGKLGNRELTREISRRMGNVSAVNSAKQLAFLHFLTARPLRQLVLQGMQHMNLQALDLSYVGKWQMDTFSLLGAMKRLSRAREDDILYGVKRTQMAKMMGYTDDELKIIMREFSQSGLVDTVDVHSYAGGMPKTAIRTPRSRIGQGLNETWTNINKPVNAARAMGFDMGEQFNVTASWLMALRRTMKENGFKKITELDSQHWDDIANRGSQYALAMHKANAATWQYGLLSLPLQFLQFTHKWLLTSLGASKTMRKLGLANQAFTQEEALKIVAMQTVMWGGAGTAALFGLRDNLENVVNSFDPDGTKLGEDGRQLLLSGLADWALDQIVRGVMNDPDLGYAWDDIFSPAMGSQMLSEKILELGTEPFMLHEVLLGPSGQVFSRYQKAFAFGQALAGKDYEHWSAGQRAQGIIEAGAAGLFAGYSDLLKVRLAAKMGQWTNAAGVPLEVEAKWLDLVLKGGFGINPDRLQNYWNYVGKLGDLKADLKDNAREHAERVNYIVMQWSDKKLGDEDALAMLNTLATVYDLYKEDGLGEQYYEQMMAEYSRLRTPDGESILKRITELLMRGYTGDVVTDLLNSGNLTPQQADELREMLNRQMSLSEENLEKRLELFELEREIVRNTTDGRP
jgi:hypothetical protein